MSTTGGMTTNGIVKIRMPQTRLKQTQVCPPIAQNTRGQLYVDVSEVSVSTFSAQLLSYFSIYKLKVNFPIKTERGLPVV